MTHSGVVKWREATASPGRVWKLLQEMAAVARLQPDLARVLPSASERRNLLRRMREITAHVPCPHNESHVLRFMVEMLKLPAEIRGVVVEAGCYRGGSTAKLSLAASRAGRELVIFDSFEGLPPNEEQHDMSILGHSIEGWFSQGEFAGRLEEVRENVRRFGEYETCRFIPGWFESTMPGFTEAVAAAYLDVDLAASTRTCVKQLYPLLSPGGFLLSQDGDFPLVIEALADRNFWEREVGCPMPPMTGLGTSKLVMIRKPAEAPAHDDQARRSVGPYAR